MHLTTIMRDGDRISIERPPQKLVAATQRLYRNRIIVGYMLRHDSDFMSHPAKTNDTPHQSGQREADTPQLLSADHVLKLLKIEPSEEPGDANGLRDGQGQMAHTPGPWQVAYWIGPINGSRHQALAIWPADIVEPFRGQPICLVSNVETEDDKDHANARLIAAAPELLCAAKKTLAFINDLSKSNPGFLGKLVLQDYAQYNEAMVELPAAIEKAERGQPTP